MKATFPYLATAMALAIVLTASASAQGLPAHVKGATAIGEVYGDGEKISAAILEYDRDIDQSKLSTATFAVTGRTITKVYANGALAKAAQGSNGRFVVIELSPDDADAPLYIGGPGSRPPGAGGPAGAGPPPGVTGPPRPPMGMPPLAKRKPLLLSVAQVGVVTTVAGKKYSANATPFVTPSGVNLLVDEFRQLEFQDPETGRTLAYNLFVPRDYDKTRSYPLVLFMHDASITGAETNRTLTQGLGAVVWASPTEQAKRAAFVVAPAFGAAASTEGAVGDATGDTVVHLVNAITSQYSIDRNRLYTTGQSFGCMLSLAIMIRHPDLFAASLLVAGQRDAQATSVLQHNKMWIIVAEGDTRAFPGMNDSVAVWEAKGTRVSKATWNARSSEAELSAEANKMLAEGNDIRYATFRKGSVFPPGKEGGIEHMATWPVAYRIESVRDWLFAQAKAGGPDAHIVDVTAITRVFADGLKVAAVALQYDRNIRDASLAPADFSVQTDVPEQRITRVYTSNDGLQTTRRGLDGRYVILELSTDYRIPIPVRKVAAPPPAGPPPSPPPPAGPQPVQEKLVLNSEVVAQVGNIVWDPAAHPATLKSTKHGGNGQSVSVLQRGEVVATDGSILRASTTPRDNFYTRNLIIDGFMKPDFASKAQGNVKYNIHFPSGYDSNRKYPVVVFLSDSDSPANYTHAEYLTHGLGAVVWADKPDDAKHPAIVVVPCFSRPLIDERYQPTVQTRPGGQTSIPYASILDLLDGLMEQVPNMDRSRLYVTGQGDGARAAIHMMADRPDLFAAALLFAPDYDASKAAQLANARLSIVVAEGDTASHASMQRFTAALKAAGNRNVRYSVLKKGAVVPPGVADDEATQHVYTWRVGYSNPALRDWLFAQSR